MLDKIIRLGKSLFPTGRAFRVPSGGVAEKTFNALSELENQAVADSLNVLDVILPDNDNFTAQDATDWEVRLGLITNTSLSLDQRKAAIIRKLNHPGRIPARQNFRYLERELRVAGFDVYVYENRFDDGGGGLETRSPGDIVGATGSTQNQLGMFQLGQFELGTDYYNKVVTSLDDSDQYFDLGNKLRRTFFISGNPITTFAEVDETRKEEFRELICKIKPAQTGGWLLVNYV